MKKILSFMAYALMMVALPLTSCGSDKDDPEDPEKPDTTVPVLSISATYDDVELTVGDEAESVGYFVSPEEATDKTVIVACSDENVCTVESMPFTNPSGPLTGNLDITPVAAGTATITLTSKSNPSVTTTIAVTVKAKGEDKPGETAKAMEKIGFYLTLADGSHKTLAPTGTSVEAQAGTEVSVSLADVSNAPFNIYMATITSARWASSNTSVATLAQSASTRDNTITLRAVGTTVISVTAPDGSQSSFTLNVKKPVSPFAIKDRSGNYRLLETVNGKAMDYDDSGLKTIADLKRLSDGRFRGGNNTLTLTFKSGTKLVEKIVSEHETTASSTSCVHQFSYDAQNRLTKCVRQITINGKTKEEETFTLSWDDEKFLSGSGKDYLHVSLTLAPAYAGNKANDLRTAGIAPFIPVFFTNTAPAEVWAALAVMGCLGQGPALVPTGYTLTYAGTEQKQIGWTLASDGMLSRETFTPLWESTSYINYTYKNAQ